MSVPIAHSDPAATVVLTSYVPDPEDAELEIEAAQGHGNVEAGKEGHLIIKLPYKDDGASVVRAWIGTGDRTLSAVGICLSLVGDELDS